MWRGKKVLESDGCPTVGMWVRGQSSMFGTDLKASAGRIDH